MALIAPGAFLWTTFQVQAAQMNGAVSTAGEMWTGLVAALVLAFLTAISYAELSEIYPKAGSGSSYYFAEAALLEKEKSAHRQWARIAKFATGWISHLYYWIYPGIMVAFSATLIVYIFGLFGVKLNVPGNPGCGHLRHYKWLHCLPGHHRFHYNLRSHQCHSTGFSAGIFGVGYNLPRWTPRVDLRGDSAVYSTPP